MTFSDPTGLRLWGMALLPFCPSANGSSASPISVRCSERISTATFSSEAATMARVVMSSAWRSRWTIWLDTGAGSSPRRWHASSSTSGSMWAKVPTAPEIFPTRTVSRARRNRSRLRPASAYQSAALRPNVMGSAWMPWLRPTQRVCRWVRASARTAARKRSSPARRISHACWSCRASAVSSTSDEVIPMWTYRESAPMASSRLVRKAMTSWRVVASISSIRWGSTLAWALIRLSASPGMTPRRP